jgi:hypothetical protein
VIAQSFALGPPSSLYAPLGDFQQDAINALAIILGQDRARSLVTDAIATLQAKAKEGAEQAIPDIRKQVKTEATSAVTPLVLGALAAAGVALATGITAIVIAKRSRR